MISTRNLIILAAVLLILVGASYLQRAQHQKETSVSSTALVMEGEFNQENISRLILGKGDNPDALVLASGPDGWIAESYFNAKVDQNRIGALLLAFSNLKGEFRSDSQEVLGDYGLLEEQAITVRGLDPSGQEVLAVNLGRTATGSQGQFMRVPDSNKVYLSQIGLLALMGVYGESVTPKAQFFLALQAVQENKLDIDRVSVRDGETTLNFRKDFGLIDPPEGSPEGTEPTIDRNTWEWLLDNEPATDLAKTKIDALLNSSTSIRPNDVADPTVSLAEYGLQNPARSLTLTRQDGSELVVEFGATREAVGDVSAGTYMRISDSPTIWVVTDYTIKNIFKTRDDLKAE
jgi:Domain of unknown function (DUF4340)